MMFLFHISAVSHPIVSFSCCEVEVLKEKFPFVVNQFLLAYLMLKCFSSDIDSDISTVVTC